LIIIKVIFDLESGAFRNPVERRLKFNLPPRAYLNWLVFDRNYAFLTGGFKQITTAAKEAGTDVPHEYIFSSPITITQPGYVYIYLSNENATPVEVFFDEFKVTHTKSPVIQMDDYYPFGLTFNSYSRENSVAQDFKYNGKELQDELGLNWLDYGARMYMPDIGRWGVIDALTEKYVRFSPYNYAVNNPVNLIDVGGFEPIKPQAGTASGFVAFLNNTSTKMGTLTGGNAQNAMRRLGQVEYSSGRPLPATTGPFNTSKDRYVYTEKGGWLDMSHVMFYAGQAYSNKERKETAQKKYDEVKGDNVAISAMGHQAYYQVTKDAMMDPVAEAVQTGYQQEALDAAGAATHSAYSYEDLPSDLIGAEFGANYFDPNSKLTMGEQLLNFLNSYGATDPSKAPNYNSLPEQDRKPKPPTRTNRTTKPVYTNENP